MRHWNASKRSVRRRRARDTELEHVDLSGGGRVGGRERGCQPRWALQSVRGRREESGVSSGGGERRIVGKKKD